MKLTTLKEIRSAKSLYEEVTGKCPNKIMMNKATYSSFFMSELIGKAGSEVYDDYVSGSIMAYGMPIYKSEVSCIL